MEELAFIESLDAATALLHPLRISLIRRMAEPRSCSELGKEIGETPQKVYYHVKVLEDRGLVDKVEERRVHGIMEGLYRARARSYWLAPELVGRVGGGRAARDQMSLGFLRELSERIQSRIGQLARASRAGSAVPTLGLTARIELRDSSEREAFKQDLQAAIERLARKYGGRHGTGEGAPDAGSAFEVAVACYPLLPGPDQTEHGRTIRDG